MCNLMKHLWVLAVIVMAGFTTGLRADPQQYYVNSYPLIAVQTNGVLPPIIDTVNFENKSIFQINTTITNGNALLFGIPDQRSFNTFNTRNYTNSPYDTTTGKGGLMVGTVGFDFSYFPDEGDTQRSDTLFNRGRIYGDKFLNVYANRIENIRGGLLSVGSQGILRLDADYIDLTLGGVDAGNNPFATYEAASNYWFQGVYVNPAGFKDTNWGAGQNGVIAGGGLPFNVDATTGGAGQNPDSFFTVANLSLGWGKSFPATEYEFLANPPDGYLSVWYSMFPYSDEDLFEAHQYQVFTNMYIVNRTNVHFNLIFTPKDQPYRVEAMWAWAPYMSSPGTNIAAIDVPVIKIFTNFYDPVLKQDVETSFYIVNHALAMGTYPSFVDDANQFSGARRPANIELRRSLPNTVTWTPVRPQPEVPAGMFASAYTAGAISYFGKNARVPYDYSVYGTQIDITNYFQLVNRAAILLDTNSPGRLEITANTLNLSNASLRAERMLEVKTTNLVGYSGLNIDAPLINFDVGVTNPTFVISNMIRPMVSRLNGDLYVYGATWTAQYTNDAPPQAITSLTMPVRNGGRTNNYIFDVTVIDFKLSNSKSTFVNKLAVRATNTVVRDGLQVNNFFTDSQSLFIGAGGFLDLAFGTNNTSWSPTIVPNLRNLTNAGIINLSAVGGIGNFYGVEQDAVKPYENFMNSGIIQAAAINVNAVNFSSQGTLAALGTSVDLEFDTGYLVSPFWQPFFRSIVSGTDVDIRGKNFVATNSTINAGVNGFVIDVKQGLGVYGSVTNYNMWDTRGGFQFLSVPTSGNLAFAHITSHLPEAGYANHVVATPDLGKTNTGFSGPGALGVLTLDGGTNAQFAFTGTGMYGANNALYVERLEFTNAAVDFDLSIFVETNMTIYYADAVTINNGVTNSVVDSLRTNAAFGKKLNWVSTFAGPSTSVPLVFPNSEGGYYTNYYNRALVTSMTLDSNQNGIPNGVEYANGGNPLFTTVTVKATPFAGPPLSMKITWNSPTNTVNTLQYNEDFVTPNWTNLWTTNSGIYTNMLFIDPVMPGLRMYRVFYDLPLEP